MNLAHYKSKTGTHQVPKHNKSLWGKKKKKLSKKIRKIS